MRGELVVVGLLQVGTSAGRVLFILICFTFPQEEKEDRDSEDLRSVVSVSAYLQGLRVKGEGSSSYQFPWTH